MNKRDGALIAHLDAMDSRWTQLFTTYHGEVMAELRHINVRLDKIHEDIAGIKIEAATHTHGDAS